MICFYNELPLGVHVCCAGDRKETVMNEQYMNIDLRLCDRIARTRETTSRQEGGEIVSIRAHVLLVSMVRAIWLIEAKPKEVENETFLILFLLCIVELVN
jgi:hypothetical protein